MLEFENCPNCQRQIPKGVTYCAHCGFKKPPMPNPHGPRLPATPPRGNAAVIWTVLFVVIGLPAGLLGSCLLLIDMSSPPNQRTLTPVAIAAFLVAVVLMVAMIRAYSKKK